MEKMSEEDFIKRLQEIGVNLSQKQINMFRIYLNTLLEYNAHTNLTAIKTPDEVYLKHFYDSLMILKYRQFERESILDLGCGAGFPGVPLKIVCPNVNLTCLDSNGKKTKFLEELKVKLNIDFDVVNDRAEKYIEKKREYFDFVVSRAVASMPILCELCMPFVKINGEFIAYKGNINNEKEDGKFACAILGGEIGAIYEDELPIEESRRTFVCVHKKCKTEPIYPRLYEKIIKKPLQNLGK